MAKKKAKNTKRDKKKVVKPVAQIIAPSAFPSWINLVAWAGGIIAVVTVLASLTGHAQKAFLAIREATRYPVRCEYVQQFESKAGYILQVRMESINGKLVHIPKSDFAATIVHDPSQMQKLDSEERSKLAYGESVEVFDNRHLLDAKLEGKSFANATNSVSVGPKPTDVFLLLTVEGPGSANPSSRLQLTKIYRSVRILLKRRGISSDYLEIPLRKVAIIGENVEIIER